MHASLRDVVQGGEDLVQELVRETLQLFDGHLDLLPHPRVGQGLLRRHVVRQLTENTKSTGHPPGQLPSRCFMA